MSSQRLRALAILLVCWSAASPVSAQTIEAPPPPSPTEVLFDPLIVRDLQLRVHSTDWEALQEHYRENTYYPADFAWNGQTVRNVGIRSRGGGSRRAEKPGLRVDFDRYTSKQKFLGLKSLVLDNLSQDQSMLREYLTFRVFQRMELPAPRATFVRLFVNGEYFGLYGLVESVDKDFLARSFNENDGYLFEYEWAPDYGFEYLGPDMEPYQPLFNPKTHEDATRDELYAPIEAMIRTANEAEDHRFESDMAEYLDLPLFMRHLALEAFLAEWDGVLGYAGMNNFYLYRFENSQRSQLIVWDKDNTFKSIDFPILNNIERNVIARRAFAVPALRKAYLDTLSGAAHNIVEGLIDEDPGTGWLAVEIERIYSLVRDAALGDVHKPFSNEQFEGEVQVLRDFARARSAFVNDEVRRLGDGGASDDPR